MAYPEGHVERFATARNIIGEEPPVGQVSLQLEGKVSMTLEAYEGIAKKMLDLMGGNR